jgi:hypothetical protein
MSVFETDNCFMVFSCDGSISRLNVLLLVQQCNRLVLEQSISQAKAILFNISTHPFHSILAREIDGYKGSIYNTS